MYPATMPSTIPIRIHAAGGNDRLLMASLHRPLAASLSAKFQCLSNAQSPPPQRYCQATAKRSKLLPVRAETPLLAANLIELRRSTGIASVAPTRQFCCRSFLVTPSIDERPPVK